MNAKKITFVSHSLRGGGAERVSCTLMRLLARHMPEIELSLILIDKAVDLKALIPPSVRVCELGLSRSRYAVFRLWKKIGQWRPDVVFTSELAVMVPLWLACCFHRKIRKIFRYSTMPDRTEKKSFTFWLMRFALQRIDGLIAQTDEMRTELTEYYRLPEDKVRTFFNPLDVDEMERATQDAVSPFEKGFFNILCCGTMYPPKGFDVAIRAMQKLRKIRPEARFRLYIVGREERNYRKNLEDLAGELGLKKEIVLIPYTPNPYPYIKFCDVFLLSSRWEGLPNVVLEALYFRRAVVATRCIPVLARLIVDGQNGFTIPVDDPEAMSAAVDRIWRTPETFCPMEWNIEKNNLSIIRYLADDSNCN